MPLAEQNNKTGLKITDKITGGAFHGAKKYRPGLVDVKAILRTAKTTVKN